MANIAVSNDWPAGVYQYADGDVLDGGAESSEVLPFKQLANRSLFQRLANITPWDSALAAEFGYPNKAVVMHGGLSWRAVVANAVEPGTDITKWERWGFTQAEIEGLVSTDAVLYVAQSLTATQRKQARTNIRAMAWYGAADALPTADQGVLWKEGVGLMVWNTTSYQELFLAQHIENETAFAIPTGYTTVCSFTAPRTGKVDIVGVTRTITSAAGAYRFHIFVQKNGVMVQPTEELSTDNGSTASEGNSISCQALSLSVVAGDEIDLILWRFSTSAGANHSGSYMTVRYIA